MSKCSDLGISFLGGGGSRVCQKCKLFSGLTTKEFLSKVFAHISHECHAPAQNKSGQIFIKRWFPYIVQNLKFSTCPLFLKQKGKSIFQYKVGLVAAPGDPIKVLEQGAPSRPRNSRGRTTSTVTARRASTTAAADDDEKTQL